MCTEVLWNIIILNDVYMLTIDHKRTYTYLGCMAVQTTVNCCFTFLIILYLALFRGYQAQAWLFNSFMEGRNRAYSNPVDITFGVFAAFAGTCSIFILAINFSAILTFRSTVPTIPLGKANTKDALSGLAPPLSRPYNLSLLGNPRPIAIPIYFPQQVVFAGKIVKRVTIHLLFHRVRNVETRIYALIRNSFALVSIIMIIFRTISALQQARNEVQTRVTSAACDFASSSHHISVLLDRPRWDDPSKEEVNVTEFTNDFYGLEYRKRRLELFACSKAPSNSEPSPSIDIDLWQWEAQYYSVSNSFAYHVQVQPGANPEIASDGQMPHVWLVNTKELPETGRSWSDVSEVRAYLSPLNLRRGSHIVSETNLITRRFIRSSILKDIIFSFKSEYRRLSLYPIFQLSAVTLNSTSINATIASATIRPTLTPVLRYHRTQAKIQDPDLSPSDTCDFIDDYRSSTVFNAIGSIGGLFALLQAMHLLLFGRPLLWSVTGQYRSSESTTSLLRVLSGAKTITPFGLLGGFSSGGFKRRLREEYHTKSTEDGTYTIQIVPFLRDFVIDFGPADFDPEWRSPRESAASLPMQEDSNEELDGSHIPLMQMDLDRRAESPRDSETEVEETNHSNDRNSIHGVV
ncbi:unnamed protein product [Rhizoctonia solani]|uniref:Uncharacterized protein n=1 Tax=Rhizoctonia solani TaxID=456999 RepID=A0A8H3I2Z9_9AGAM|nr:unnamed protein product [Rhizoctonia solani]